MALNRKYEKQFEQLKKNWDELAKNYDRKHWEKFSKELIKFKNNFQDIDFE